MHNDKAMQPHIVPQPNTLKNLALWRLTSDLLSAVGCGDLNGCRRVASAPANVSTLGSRGARWTSSLLHT